MPVLVVCVTEAGTVPIDGTVEVRADDSDPDPITLILDEEGCASYSVPGAWEVRGITSGGSCVSDWEAAEVVDCEESQLDIEVIDFCMDGR
jgi:hypothetical protein